MVSSINYAITANIDSIECGTMQQQLLWMLYDRGHLKNYPMALGMLLLHLTTLHFMCNNLNSDSETHSPSPNLEKYISLKFLVGQIIKRNIQFPANLGDCEEISPTLGRPPCHKIFQEAISVNKIVYDNHHVYPYTYQAGYYYRTKQFKKALEGWAAAADVIKL